MANGRRTQAAIAKERARIQREKERLQKQRERKALQDDLAMLKKERRSLQAERRRASVSPEFRKRVSSGLKLLDKAYSQLAGPPPKKKPKRKVGC